MKRFTTLANLAVIAGTLFGATAAFAVPMPYTSFLVATDPTQKGRLSRNGVPQDESGGTLPGIESYPGVINPTTSYHYHVYSINVGAVDTIIYLTMNSGSTTTFLSAYQSAYYVTNPQTSWLGDAGTSGLSFGTDPQSFNVLAAANSTLVLLVNETTTNGGLNAANTFTLYAQATSVADENNGIDPIDIAIVNGGQVIPEPSTLLLLAPLAVFAGLKSRRRRQAPAALLAA